MGSHSSKAAKGDVVAQHPADAAAASPSKSNGQENGHVKINGDVSPKPDGEATPLDGNGSAEPVREEPKVDVGSGDAIEPAPVVEGAENKPEGGATSAAPKETPKKKKKFSFKKSFKLSGISFRKTKKEAGDSSNVSSPTEEQGKAEGKAEEENPTSATAGEAVPADATKEEALEEKAAPPAEALAPAPAPASAPAAEDHQEAESKREDSSRTGQVKEEETPQPAPEVQEAMKPEETSTPAEIEPSPTPAVTEQKEE